MKPLVFNATPLIYITKIGLAKIFEQLKDEKLTSPHVKREVVDKGKRKGIPDAIILDKMFTNHVFKVTETKNRKLLAGLLETKGLHITDAEVLVIAQEQNGIAIIDDEVARKTAKIYEIQCAGTPYILMRAVLHGLITKERAKQAINEMTTAGWRCSLESYAKIMEAIERCDKGQGRNPIEKAKQKTSQQPSKEQGKTTNVEEGSTRKIPIKKAKKEGFGVLKGSSAFTAKDELTAQN